jgi:HK97 family phage prohead protease
MRPLSTREIETRGTPLAVELRRSAASRAIGGYCVVFGSQSQNLGGFTEVVEPRAIAKTQADGWPGCVCRYEHDDRMLLGTVAAGTLQLSVDPRGVDYTVECPRSRDDVLELVERRDIQASSFSFQAYEQEWTHENGMHPVRHLLGIRLLDCAPVVRPAYADASVALRSLGIQFDADPEDVFDMARDKQLSKLFCRTDNRGQPVKTRSGRQALTEPMAMTTHERRTRTWHQAQVELMAMRWPPERRSGKQAQLETMAARWAPWEGGGY